MRKLVFILNLVLILSCCCFGDTFTSHLKPNAIGTLDIGTTSLLWQYIYSQSFTDGTASWTNNSLSGFTSISGTTLTDGIFTVSGGIISAGTWQGSTITVPYGGTGATSLTDGGILLGSGTSAVTALAVASNGQIPIGDGVTGPTLATLTATALETEITNAAGSITIGLPDDVTIASLTVSNLTEGRVTFAGASGLLTDDADMTFATDTLTVTKLGAFEATGAINFATQNMTNVDIDSGTVDGITTLGLANSVDVGNWTITANGLTIDGTFTDGTATITGGDGSGFTSFVVDNLTFDNATITSDISLLFQTSIIDTGATIQGLSDAFTLTAVNDDFAINADGGNITLNAFLSVDIDASAAITLTTTVNNDITLTTSGTGEFIVSGDMRQTGDFDLNGGLDVLNNLNVDGDTTVDKLTAVGDDGGAGIDGDPISLTGGSGGTGTASEGGGPASLTLDGGTKGGSLGVAGPGADSVWLGGSGGIGENADAQGGNLYATTQTARGGGFGDGTYGNLYLLKDGGKIRIGGAVVPTALIHINSAITDTILSITATGLAENAVALAINSNERGVQVTTSDERCIFGNATTSGTGVQGTSSSGVGVDGSSVTGLAGRFSLTSATTNTILDVLELRRTTTDPGHGANGIGGSICHRLENDAGTTQLAAVIDVVMTDVTDGAEVTEYRVRIRDGANGPILKLLVDIDGIIVGGGQTGVDHILTFDGENSDQTITGKEDEDLLEVSTFLRDTNADYRRYYHLDLASFNPGASGATWIMARDGDTVGGWQLNNVNEVLESKVDVHADWDGLSDLTMDVRFQINVTSAENETVDIQIILYYMGVGDSSPKTQIIEIATNVGDGGANARYTMFQTEFPINYDEGGNVVDVGDCIGFKINLETDTSEVDDIIINAVTYHYNTTHVGIESGDT